MTTTTPISTTTPAEAPHVWLAYAELGVLAGLNYIGRTLLKKGGRDIRNHTRGLNEVYPEHWHTKIKLIDITDDVAGLIEQLVDEALRFFTETRPLTDRATADCVRDVCRDYLRQTVTKRRRHDRVILARMLHEAGCVEENPAA